MTTCLLFLVAERLAGLIAVELLDALGVALGAALARVGLAAVATAQRVHFFSVLVPFSQNCTGWREKVLTVSSHQLIIARKWYGWIGLG